MSAPWRALGLRPDLPAEHWQRLQRRRAATVARFAIKQCPYYRSNIGASVPRSWTLIPVLRPDVLAEQLPPYGKGLLSGARYTHVFASGATGGDPKYLPRSVEEYPGYVPAVAEALLRGGLRSSDLVANLFHAGQLYTSFLFFEEVLRSARVASLPLAAEAPLDGVIEVFERFPPDVLAGTPSCLIRLAEFAIQRQVRLTPRIVYYGSEPVFPPQRDFLATAFGGAAVRSACYAGTDCGPIGYDCGRLPPNCHHIFELQSLVEVVAPDTDRPVPVGEVGEVVVTSLHRFVAPILRYATGDLGRFVDGMCTCGSTHRVLAFEGRTGGNLRMLALDLSIQTLGEWIAEALGRHRPFCAIADLARKGQTLTITVEEDEMAEETRLRIETRLAARVINRVGLEHAREIALAVKLVPVGHIAPDPRTGKTRYFVDRRLSASASTR